jgi:hypothetical protein
LKRALALGASALALLCLGSVAQAELTQEGDLRASFEGAITPKELPRDSYAPVGVRVAGGVRALGGSRLPQLQKIRVAINEAGKLYDKGLPTCEVSKIQPATEAVAKSICGDSIVGEGKVALQVRLPGQKDYRSTNKLLAFNGPYRKGKKLILAQVYSINPPGAIVLTFEVKKQKGLYGTVLETKLPNYAESWAYLTFFELKLERTYFHAGKQRSYVSASCSTPDGFTQATFPFAKASYKFSGGKTLTTSIQRTCRVKGE